VGDIEILRYSDIQIFRHNIPISRYPNILISRMELPDVQVSDTTKAK